MIDTSKRKSLKAVAAAAALTAIPAIAQAAAVSTTHSDITSVVDHLRTHFDGLGLKLNVVPTPGHASLAVQLTNTSNEPVMLNHIAPGLVRSGGNLYDLNSMLDTAGERFIPGEPHRYMVSPMAQAIS